MHYGFKIGLLTTISAGCAAFAEPVAAQDGASSSDETRIIVTSRKREENLIEVPLAVTVVTGEQLQRDQVYNLNDLQRTAPALEISQTAGAENNGGARLRGLGTGVFNNSVSSSVALVIDQVPVGNLSFPLLYDLAQIEVLRGPQGTLFGQGASAGVVNITTRAPEFDRIAVNGGLDWADKGTAGSEVGELIAHGGFNLPLGETLALRVAAQFKRETGLQHSITTGRDNEISDYGIRGRLRFEPTDTLSIMLSGEYGKQTSDGQTFFSMVVAPNSTRPFGPPGGTLGGIASAAYLNPAGCAMPSFDPRAEFYCENQPSDLAQSISSGSAVIDLELSDSLSLTSVTAYRARSFSQFHRDFTRLTTSPSARQERTQEDSNGFSQELRLSLTTDSFDLVGGAYYTDFEFNSSPTGSPPFTYGSTLPLERIGFSVCTYTGGFCPVPASFTQETTENRTIAVFADATVQLGEVVELFGGLRYNSYRNSTTVQDIGLTAGPIDTFDNEDSNLSGRIGVSYMPNSDVNLFASYSRGYKPPAAGSDATGFFQLEAETANAFELGLKVGVGALQLTANAFYNELKNFQSQTSEFIGGALISTPVNVPQVTSKGIELNAFGELVDGFNVNAGYQFNIVEYPNGFTGDDGLNLGGRQFLFAPKHKFTLSGEYAHQVTDGVELFLNANMIYKSETLLLAVTDPRFRYPGHAIFNTGFGVRDADGGWTASVFVRNLTKEREPTAYFASTFAGQNDGGIRAWPVAGLTARVVGVRLGFDF